MPGYEETLDLIAAVPRGTEGRDRTIHWLHKGEVVGAARDHLGRIELFLAGASLHPQTKTVRDAMQHHSWHRERDSDLNANRLVFPAFGHFDQLAALIATNLLRDGADSDLQHAFANTEPIIELSIKRLELSESAFIGLAGELLLLDALARRINVSHLGHLLAAWNGWRRSTRDISWGGTGVEIKTTTRASSSHLVQGTHQVEVAKGDTTTPGEDRLLLVSIGLQRSAICANSFTVPGLTQRIVDRLEATANENHVGEFLSHITEYGSESSPGYRHPSMANDLPFTTAFTPSFIRAYDMADPQIEVIRREDMALHRHVDPSSVSFRVELPMSINLDNPVEGLFRVADTILNG